jgi:hypothetical protein
VRHAPGLVEESTVNDVLDTESGKIIEIIVIGLRSDDKM